MSTGCQVILQKNFTDLGSETVADAWRLFSFAPVVIHDDWVTVTGREADDGRVTRTDRSRNGALEALETHHSALSQEERTRSIVNPNEEAMRRLREYSICRGGRSPGLRRLPSRYLPPGEVLFKKFTSGLAEATIAVLLCTMSAAPISLP